MGVEHQVEQRRTAMARSGDVDHPHSTPLIRGACLAPQKNAAYRLGRAWLPCDILGLRHVVLRQLGVETRGRTGVRLADGHRHPQAEQRTIRQRRFTMFTRTALLLSAASLALGAAAASPAMANYDRCYEQPYAKGCPGNFD